MKIIRWALTAFGWFFLSSNLWAYPFPLPDTGQTKCYDDTSEIPCPEPGADYYGQDGSYLINPPSYTKLDASGNDLPDTATSWVTVRDNVTGLIWEVKTDYGVHKMVNKYTWYDSNPATNGGAAGTPGNGTDTEDFISALNAENFGGHNDWRLPTLKELASIANLGREMLAIDTEYFPNTRLGEYWSSTKEAGISKRRWYFGFLNGCDAYINGYTSNAYYVRAVRGGLSGLLDPLVINGDGTVTDTSTGLIWQQDDTENKMTWESAISYCEGLSLAGHTDWRLPNREELRSIVDYSTDWPAIDIKYFPNTLLNYYWSSTTYPSSNSYACYMSFTNGEEQGNNKSNTYYVRAVRGGQVLTSPAVTTSAVSSITSGGAQSGGNVTSEGGASVTARGVCWSASANPTVSDSHTSDSTGTGSFTSAITGLNPGTLYHVRAYATNSVGTSYGSDVGFTTSAPPTTTTSTTTTTTTSTSSTTTTKASTTTTTTSSTTTTLLALPTVATGSADPVTSDSATLNGTVNPNGSSATYYFEYEKDTNYGSFTAYRSVGAGTGAVAVSAYIPGLNPNSTYHYRLVAVNSFGTTDGADRTFTTSAPPAAKPTVTTGWANSVKGSLARLNGAVNPNGIETAYYFQYGANTDYGSVTTTTSVGDGTNDVSVNAALTGLTPNTPYHFRLVGMNSAGITYGTDQSFETGAIARAIIVAGGGAFPGNNIWDATEMVASYAFNALLFQGYSKETIYFLSSNRACDVDGDGISDVDVDATSANLASAIKIWARESSDLFIYLVDHGGIGEFLISPGVILPAADLDTWIDDLQNNGVEKVVVVYDACHSGSFIPLLAPPAGKQRVLVTSTASVERSLFCNRGKASFSYFFWGSIFNGDRFYDAFVDGTNSVKLTFPDHMAPQVEAVWDGIANEKDDKTLASQVEIGSGFSSAAGIPTIGSVSPPQTIYVGTSALIFAKNVVALGEVSRVWAVITPPDYATGDDSPVSDLPVCDLSQGSGQYEGTYGGFSTEGTYNITVFAEDKEGFLSLPVQTVVNVVSAPQVDKPPTVTTGSAVSVGKDQAALSGTVNPNGAGTSYYFEYGKIGSYGGTTTSGVVGNGTEAVPVNTSVTGLEPGADYHFRLVGTSNGGITYGNDQRFKTTYSDVLYVNPKDPACYATIQEAIDKADTGAEIRIVGGTYAESFELKVSSILTLSGRWNDGFTEQTGDAAIIKAPKATKGSLTLQNVNIKP